MQMRSMADVDHADLGGFGQPGRQGVRPPHGVRHRTESERAPHLRTRCPPLPRFQPGPTRATGALGGAPRRLLAFRASRAGRVDPQQPSHRDPAHAGTGSAGRRRRGHVGPLRRGFSAAISCASAWRHRQREREGRGHRSWSSPRTLPSGSVTVATRRPPPTSRTGSFTVPPAPVTSASFASMSGTCQ